MSKKYLDTNALHPEAKRLKDFLESKLIGQKRAIDEVVKAYNYFLSPLWEPEKPILALLSMGPSGAGKTFLAELLALYFCDNLSGLTKVESENFSEKHEISKLIGSPPGYVGYGEEPLFSQGRIDKPGLDKIVREFRESGDEEFARLGKEVADCWREFVAAGPQAKGMRFMQYQDKLREYDAYLSHKAYESPIFSVVLIDELEKAHPSLENFLLEVTSKGRTTLGNGEETSFVHSFIIMTSNIGSTQIAKVVRGAAGMGFHGYSSDKVAPSQAGQAIYEAAMRDAKKVFKTEFLGRISKVVYHPLTKEQLQIILTRQIFELISMLRENDFQFELNISQSVMDFILQEATDHPEYGARLLEDKVRKYLEEPIATLINSEQVTLEDKKLCVSLQERKGKKPKTIFWKRNVRRTKV